MTLYDGRLWDYRHSRACVECWKYEAEVAMHQRDAARRAYKANSKKNSHLKSDYARAKEAYTEAKRALHHAKCELQKATLWLEDASQAPPPKWPPPLDTVLADYDKIFKHFCAQMPSGVNPKSFSELEDAIERYKLYSQIDRKPAEAVLFTIRHELNLRGGDPDTLVREPRWVFRAGG